MNHYVSEQPVNEHKGSTTGNNRKKCRCADDCPTQDCTEYDGDDIIERRMKPERPASGNPDQNQRNDKDYDRSGSHLKNIQVSARTKYFVEDLHLYLFYVFITRKYMPAMPDALRLIPPAEEPVII
jgi:hypothetical protein